MNRHFTTIDEAERDPRAFFTSIACFIMDQAEKQCRGKDVDSIVVEEIAARRLHLEDLQSPEAGMTSFRTRDAETGEAVTLRIGLIEIGRRLSDDPGIALSRVYARVRGLVAFIVREKMKGGGAARLDEPDRHADTGGEMDPAELVERLDAIAYLRDHLNEQDQEALRDAYVASGTMTSKARLRNTNRSMLDRNFRRAKGNAERFFKGG